MKRFHVHVSVKDLGESLPFYSKLFGAEPSVSKTDYAKWMLDDPRINFAISQRGANVGLNHLGIQVDSAEALAGLRAQAEAADFTAVEESGAACCYAKSDKYWIQDPSGIAWETFNTLGEIPVFGAEPSETESATAKPEEIAGGCCAPKTKTQTACCPTS